MQVCWRSFVVVVWGFLLSISLLQILYAQEVDSPEQAEVTQPSANSEEFDKRLDRLQRTNPAQGRVTIITSCQQLLKEFPEHPRRAEVMLRIAQLYDLTNPEAGFRAKPAASLRWYRKAVSVATVGGEAWCNANMGVANHMQYPDSSAEQLRESRTLLETVVREAKSPLMMLQAELNLIHQSQFENNPLGMELHAKRVLDWKEDTSNVELTEQQRQQLRMMQGAASHQLMTMAVDATTMDGLATASMAGPKESRIGYVDQLAENYPTPEVKLHAAEARQRITSRTDAPDNSDFSVQLPLQESEPTTTRRFFLVLNVAVVLALGIALLVRRKQRQYYAV